MEEIIHIKVDHFEKYEKDTDISLSFVKRSYYTNLVISYNSNFLFIFHEAYTIINLTKIQESEKELIFKINIEKSLKDKKNNFQIDLTKLSVYVAKNFIEDDNYSRLEFFGNMHKRMPKIGEYIFKEATNIEAYLTEDEFNQWHTQSSFLRAKTMDNILKKFFLLRDWIVDFYKDNEYYSIEKRNDIVKIKLL